MANNIDELLGAHIRNLRREQSVSINKFNKFGITQSTLSRLESGKISTRLETLEKIAGAFNLEPYELLRDALQNKSMISNKGIKNEEIHRLFSFVAGYSPEFVRECIKERDLTSESYILDPFAGCGTTLVEANKQNIKSLGFDPHIFFYKICKSKIMFSSDLSYSYFHEIHEVFKNIQPMEYKSVYSVDALKYLEKIISTENLGYLTAAVQSTLSNNFKRNYNNENFRYLFITKILQYCCTTKIDGIYLSTTNLKKKEVKFREAVEKAYQDILDALNYTLSEKINNKAEVYNQSSEENTKLINKRFDMCITSPPYLNNFDYAEMTRLYLYFWQEAESWNDITHKVRLKLLPNNTTCLKDYKSKQPIHKSNLSSSIQNKLERIYDELLDIYESGPNKKKYHYLLYPYFSTLQNIFKNISTYLTPEASVNIVIADSALYGVYIPVHVLFSEILEGIGYKKVEFKKMGAKGDRWLSAKNPYIGPKRGDYWVHATK